MQSHHRLFIAGDKDPIVGREVQKRIFSNNSRSRFIHRNEDVGQVRVLHSSAVLVKLRLYT